MKLYHGSSVSWLAVSGFSRTKHCFGEACPPHHFVFLSAAKTGADNAALIACRRAIDRISREDYDLSLDNFCFMGITYPPSASVYEVEIPSAALKFDWAMTGSLQKCDQTRILKTLRQFHLAAGPIGWFKFLIRLVRLYRDNSHWKGWKEWIEFVAKSYMKGPYLDRLAAFFASAGYELIKNLEGDGDGQGYVAVYALVLPEKGCSPYMPCLI